MSTELEDARNFWNRVADDWQTQVGRDGDANRRLNSDPVLWRFAGNVRGLKVLDAGCGTGYLSIKLAERGAVVTGIDFSERMIAIARATDSITEFRVDSCSELSTIEDDAFDMVVPIYRKLADTVSPDDLILMGDSAGGGFALALAQYLYKHNIRQPAQIFLLSPWLDVTLKNPAIKQIDPLDPFLGVEGLKRAGRLYAGDADPEMYLISPINGSMDGLSKIYVFVGSRDILAADARRLKALLEEKNIPIQYYEYKDMIHVWMFLNFPESKKARNEIVQLIRSGAVPLKTLSASISTH